MSDEDTCKHENWEWIDVGSDISYAEIICCDCEAQTMVYFPHNIMTNICWDD